MGDCSISVLMGCPFGLCADFIADVVVHPPSAMPSKQMDRVWALLGEKDIADIPESLKSRRRMFIQVVRRGDQ